MTGPPDSTRKEHLPDDLLAALMEGAVSSNERIRAEEHLAECAVCAAVVAVAVSALAPSEAEGGVRVLEGRIPSTYRYGTSVLAAAGLAAVLLLPLTRWSREGVLAPLVDATRTGRVVEARMTGGFEAAPLAPLLRDGSGTPGDGEDEVARFAAAARVEAAAAKRPGAEAEALRGIAQLATGRVDRAVDTLRRAAALAPQDGRIGSDLAAALLERSRRNNDPKDAAEALDVILGVLEREPRMPEALFNRGVAYERLGDRERAREAFDGYLRVDLDSAWRRDAVRRRDALRRPPRQESGGRDPTHVGAGAPLPRWAALVVGGDLERADRLLEGVVASTDELLRQTARAIAVSKRQKVIAAAVLTAARGRQREAALDWRGALALWDEAAKPLEAEGVPLSLACRFRSAVCSFRLERSGEQSEALETLATRVDERGFLDLGARVHWTLGLVRGTLGEYGEARASYDRGRSLADRAGDVASAAVLDGLAAEVLHLLGNDLEAWRYRGRGLANVDALSPDRAHVAFHETARAARDSGWYRLALDFLEGDRLRAEELGPRALAEVEIERATVAELMGRAGIRAEALVNAAVATRRVEDEGHRRFLSGLLAELRTEAAAPRDPKMALEASRHARAAAFARKELRMDRATAYLESGDVDRARREAATALALFEHEIETARGDGVHLVERASAFLERARRILHPRPDASELVSFVERFRARDLLGALHQKGRAPRRPLSAKDLQAALEPGDAILWISFEGRNLEVLRVDPGSVRAVRREVDPPAVEATVLRFTKVWAGGAIHEIQTVTSEIEALLAPVFSTRELPERLAIVPDGPFWRLPFWALSDASGQPIGARSAIVLSPSGTLAVLSAPEPATNAALVVGDAATRLHRLAGAELEAREAARRLGATEVLLGASATRSGFLSSLPNVRFVHVAAHARAAGDGRGAALLLSDGDLDEAQLSSVELPGGSVVVLSACDSLSGSPLAGEGPKSIARAFLRSGARHVLGHLGPLADDVDPARLAGFERGILAGRAPAVAWRDSIRDGSRVDPPRSAWALLGPLR